VDNIFGKSNLWIQDPEIIQELLTTKNPWFDKTGSWKIMFEEFFGDGFLFAVGDEKWQVKRKAMAHAFYKDRMDHMLDTLKEKVSSMVKEWQARIEASPFKHTKIDISKEFELLFARNIVHIAFGEDIAHEYEVKILHRQDKQASLPLIEKTVPLDKAMGECFELSFIQLLQCRMNNPLFLPIYNLTGWLVPFTHF
jgi:cytochrome P450